MWKSRNKTDLMIEVWEKLDCESVGRRELEAIATAVEAEFGAAAVDNPMRAARLLADEGAVLRHSEIMELYLETAALEVHDAALDGILKLDTLSSARASLLELEATRKRLVKEKGKDAERAVRRVALEAKTELAMMIDDPRTESLKRQIAIEIAEWLSHWLQTPALFADWIDLRTRSKDFVERFGKIAPEADK